MKYIALIPAAGVGSRFGADCPKQYLTLAGQTVLQHTIDIFQKNAHIAHIAVVVSPDDGYIDDVVQDSERVAVYRVGGASRAESVRNGLNHILNQHIILPDDVVLVHDAARCCLPATALQRLLDEAGTMAQGGILAIPVADTLKRQKNQNNEIAETISRSHLWQAQTPQLFQAALLQKSLNDVDLNGITDEASAVERLGVSPLLVQGDARNVKLTRADDMDYIQWLLEKNQSII